MTRRICNPPNPLRLLFLIAMLVTAQVAAGSNFRFRQISQDEGLSQSTVYCIFQDHLGYIWFGTYDGLNRYDGYQFVQYKLDPDDPTSLSNNRILTIYEDRNQRLWVGTGGGGLNRLDRQSGTFVRYQHVEEDPHSLSGDRVYSILEDRRGNIWVGTWGEGLNRLDPSTGRFTHYRRESSNAGTISHNRIPVLLEDRKGRLWVGTSAGGLNRYNEETDGFTHYKHLKNDPNSLSDNQISAVIEGRDGFLWVGTSRGGLNRFDPEQGDVVRYQHETDNFHSLISNKIHALCEDELGQIWVATDRGLDRLDKLSHTFVHYQHDLDDPETLSDNEVFSLLQDRSGVFWVGTRSGGINKFERGQQRFQLFQHIPGDAQSLADNRVNALYQDRMGRVWVGTGGSGLDHYDPDTGRFRHFRHTDADDRSLSGNTVHYIREDRKNNLWVATRSGLNRMPIDGDGAFEHYRHNPEVPDSLASDEVWTLLVDHRDQLWVGTTGGLDRLEDGAGFSHDVSVPSRSNTLRDNVIWALYEDHRGRLWVGTENGGLSMREDDGTFVNYLNDPHVPNTLSNNTVLTLFQEGNTLWVGTWGGGLNGFNLETERFTHLDERDGLPNGVVYGILGDGRGNLWISTNRGLSLFNPRSNAFRNYATNDGLQGMEFNPGACYRGQKGEMFFGGNSGFNAFHPDNFRENTQPPDVLITRFLEHDNRVGLNLLGKTSYELSHKQNYLTFEFTAFDYTNPEQNRYLYRLEGQDQDWLDGKHRFVRYSNLEPGTYSFRVKASNNDNVWNEEGAVVDIEIVPPFHRTRLFYALCVFLVLSLFAGVVVLQRHMLKQEEVKALVALELKRKTAELEEARNLQLSMLPRQLPSLPHLQLAVAMETATEVGGDYYDFYVDEDGFLTAAVGDATGHGLRAGTLVAAAKGLFLTMVGEVAPVELLTRASYTLRSMGFKNMFMSMALARFEGHTMRVAMAGMPPIYIYRAESGLVEEVAHKAMPLGGLPFPYKETRLQLKAGDVVLFNSDGLEERFNESMAMLSGKRVRRRFAAVADQTPSQIIKLLLDFGHEWAGSRPQDDDITLVVVKVKQ